MQNHDQVGNRPLGDRLWQVIGFEGAKGLWEAWLDEMRVDTPRWRAYAAAGWKPGASAEVASGTSRIGWAGTLSQPLLREWEIELPAGILLTQAEGTERIGEVDRAVALDHDVIGAAEALPLVAVGQHGALAVLLDPHERAARKGGDDQPPLAVESQPVRADHGEFFEPGIVALAAVVLYAAPAPDLRPVVADIAEIDRRSAVRCELPDHIARDIGEQQIPFPAVLHPHRPFREAKAALDQLDLGIGRDQHIQGRIKPHDGVVFRRLSACNETREHACNRGFQYSGHLLLRQSKQNGWTWRRIQLRRMGIPRILTPFMSARIQTITLLRS